MNWFHSTIRKGRERQRCDALDSLAAEGEEKKLINKSEQCRSIKKTKGTLFSH